MACRWLEDTLKPGEHERIHRLDAISTKRVQQIKAALQGRAPKTVNNVITVLNTALKKAIECGKSSIGCRASFGSGECRHRVANCHDVEDFERLIQAARKQGHDAYLVVLLGGEAGLRRGEITGVAMERDRLQEAATLRVSVIGEGKGPKLQRVDGSGTCR